MDQYNQNLHSNHLVIFNSKMNHLRSPYFKFIYRKQMFNNSIKSNYAEIIRIIINNFAINF
jgi:hypothetical protein